MSTTLAQPSPLPVLRRPLPSWARRLLQSPVVQGLTDPHGIGRYLEQISPSWSLEPDRAVVVGVQPQTADTTTLMLRPLDGPRHFRAGQFVRLTVEVNGVRRTRCFSLSCSAHRGDGLLEITVKAHPDGLVSRHLVQHAEPGLVVGLGAPQGTFVLPEPRPDRLLLLSGGSGITPVMSMLRTLLDEEYRGSISFVHYARTPEDAIFGAELEELAADHPGLESTIVFTRTGPGPLSRGMTGRFRAEHMDRIAPDPGNVDTYACGPEGMLEEIRRAWTEAGAEDRLHTERFTSALPSHETTRPTGGTVRFEAAGLSTEDDGRPLLEQAEGAGLRPEHGCRMGVCHTCTCRLRSGRVRNLLTGETRSEPDSEIQICVNVPEGDVALDL